MATHSKRLWLEEDIEEDLRWSFIIKEILHSGHSDFQDVELVDSGPFGKVLLLDGKLQSAEADEIAYHECLVHPALAHHPNPKNVFIMGGGEGSTAREVLKHKGVERCTMVDIDGVVVEFCKKHLDVNEEAFADPRLDLIIDDAKAGLERSEILYDVIIGDLADPVYGNPCYQLYTKEFYEDVLIKKLAPGGIFATQSGPAGILTCKQVYTAINSTLRQVFPKVVAYAAHIPSFADTWGWQLCFTDGQQEKLGGAALEAALQEKFNPKYETHFMDAQAWDACTGLNKIVRKALADEKKAYTLANPAFIHGAGIAHE